MEDNYNDQEVSSQPAAEAAPPTAAPAPSAAPQIDYTRIQSEINKTVENNLKSNPQFQMFQKFNEFNSAQTKPKNPFEEGLGLQNVTDAAEFTYNQLTAQEKKILELEQKHQQLEAAERERVYNNATENFVSYWEDSYPDEDSFNNAIAEAITSNKDLKEFHDYVQQGKITYTPEFIAELNQTMTNLWTHKLRDPNSGVLDNLVKNQMKRKSLQDQSMLSSGSQTTDSGKTKDMYSSTLQIFDD